MINREILTYVLKIFICMRSASGKYMYNLTYLRHCLAKKLFLRVVFRSLRGCDKLGNMLRVKESETPSLMDIGLGELYWVRGGGVELSILVLIHREAERTGFHYYSKSWTCRQQSPRRQSYSSAIFRSN